MWIENWLLVDYATNR
ncbi:Protein of unknown function [Bacillus cereus]|uniref:Uncharacterized protein n=1 Tax=Bacillus wiedmannii TaxID=1890302 RepID=A0AB37YYC7_9BACI|nr:Protein of unknown function [Bacillus wiedmannii]SCC64525.1 Protein of unknown function [Bacillus cereus]